MEIPVSLYGIQIFKIKGDYMENWKEIDLCGGIRIEKLVDVYEIFDMRIDGGGYRVQIFETINSDFHGYPNVAYQDENNVAVLVMGEGKIIIDALKDTMGKFIASLPEGINGEPERFRWKIDGF